MRKNCILVLMVTISLSFTTLSHAQRFLDKLKDKTEDKIIDGIFNDEKKDTQETQQSEQSTTANTRGEGLNATSIDVPGSMDEASTAYQASNYTQSRNAIRQAIQGIELEIGKKVLESLPQSVSDLSKQKDADNVTSSGMNFAGLVIERGYAKGDQELKVTIANNSAWLSAVNLYLSGGGYASTENQENYKKITFQGYQGVIEFDQSSGYKLSVPFGQTSIFILNGTNFDNEQQMMNAAGEFSIDNIKKQLGEQ